jgi:hypothetical protein
MRMVLTSSVTTLADGYIRRYIWVIRRLQALVVASDHDHIGHFIRRRALRFWDQCHCQHNSRYEPDHARVFIPELAWDMNLCLMWKRIWYMFNYRNDNPHIHVVTKTL